MALIQNDLSYLKAKFHYASWFEAGRRPAWSATSFEPASNQLA